MAKFHTLTVSDIRTETPDTVSIAFEVPSATDFGHKSITGTFSPNLFIDISDTIDSKIKALKEYQDEMRMKPHTRSFEGILNLSKYRGNQVGVSYAESFEIIRKIIR